jgi:hypothetical protein
MSSPNQNYGRRHFGRASRLHIFYRNGHSVFQKGWAGQEDGGGLSEKRMADLVICGRIGAQVLAYFGVDYFDQSKFVWYLFLVLIGTVTAPAPATNAIRAPQSASLPLDWFGAPSVPSESPQFGVDQPQPTPDRRGSSSPPGTNYIGRVSRAADFRSGMYLRFSTQSLPLFSWVL